MPELIIGMDLVGADPALIRLTGIERRYLEHEEVFGEVVELLEDREREVFDSWAGRYVDTGALRDSLTDSGADGAIREVHGDVFDFGSGIPYAIYQRDNGRSAVMRFDQADYEAVGSVILRYIVDGLPG